MNALKGEFNPEYERFRSRVIDARIAMNAATKKYEDELAAFKEKYPLAVTPTV